MPDDGRILVLSDRRASPDGGERFYNYVADEVYSGGTVPPMSPDLAAQAVREGWGEAIRDAANRKRSEATRSQPRTEDGTRLASGGATVSGTTRQPERTSTAKASASGTNRGAVEREAQAGPDASCLWCTAPYTARTGHGGPAQRFCSDACRAAFHRGARRWAARELEAGRLDIADLRNA